MISNQILQNTIEGLKAITRIDLCVVDIEGKVLAGTCTETDDYATSIKSFVRFTCRQPGGARMSIF